MIYREPKLERGLVFLFFSSSTRGTYRETFKEHQSPFSGGLARLAQSIQVALGVAVWFRRDFFGCGMQVWGFLLSGSGSASVSRDSHMAVVSMALRCGAGSHCLRFIALSV